MSNKKVILLLALLTPFAFYAAQSSGQRKSDDVRAFMRVKLNHAQEVLEGISLEDYDKIAHGAQRMSLLSMESNWRVLQTSQYLERSVAFRRITDRMQKAAKAKNLDAATLAYVEMTLSCVQCHKYVRAVER